MHAKRGGPKARRLAAAIREQLGVENPDVWYEPINGPCMEMQGYAGGWYWSEEAGDDFGEPLGYNFDEAMKMIELTARLRKQELGA